MMRLINPLAMLPILAFSIEAGAQIYRCEIEGQITFSDTPCSIEARPWQSSGNFSIIAAPEGLDRIREENRSFVDQRREELRQRLEQSRTRQALMTPPVAPGIGERFLPYRGVALHRPAFSPVHPDRRRLRERSPEPENAEVFQPGNTLLSRSGSTSRKILR